jgi:hypothetical protein
MTIYSSMVLVPTGKFNSSDLSKGDGIKMKNTLRPTARKNDLVIQEADGELLVYDLKTNKAACLNDTAAFVWQNCDGVNAIADIAHALGRKSNSSVNDDVVWLAIDELSKHKLLEDEVAAEYSLTGFSRRDVIKKIGLGTMIALPVIATLIAPQVALAVGSCGAACINPSDCPNMVCNSCPATMICT